MLQLTHLRKKLDTLRVFKRTQPLLPALLYLQCRALRIRPFLLGRSSRIKIVRYDRNEHRRRNCIELMFSSPTDRRHISMRYDCCARAFVFNTSLMAIFVHAWERGGYAHALRLCHTIGSSVLELSSWFESEVQEFSVSIFSKAAKTRRTCFSL